jgi:hypothetical protein
VQLASVTIADTPAAKSGVPRLPSEHEEMIRYWICQVVVDTQAAPTKHQPNGYVRKRSKTRRPKQAPSFDRSLPGRACGELVRMTDRFQVQALAESASPWSTDGLLSSLVSDLGPQPDKADDDRQFGSNITTCDGTIFSSHL